VSAYDSVFLKIKAELLFVSCQSLLPFNVAATCKTIDPVCIGGEEVVEEGSKKVNKKGSSKAGETRNRNLQAVDKGAKKGSEEEPIVEQPVAPSTLFCTTPKIKADVDIDALLAGEPDFFSIDVCFDVSVLDFALPSDLCISSAIDALAPAVAADAACNAAVGETKCSGCTKCPEGGFKFDCSNINAELLSTTCSNGFSPFAFGGAEDADAVAAQLLDGLNR